MRARGGTGLKELWTSFLLLPSVLRTVAMVRGVHLTLPCQKNDSYPVQAVHVGTLIQQQKQAHSVESSWHWLYPFACHEGQENSTSLPCPTSSTWEEASVLVESSNRWRDVIE